MSGLYKIAEMIRATHAYAKRQRTWFRHQLPGAAVVLAGGTPDETLSSAFAVLA